MADESAQNLESQVEAPVDSPEVDEKPDEIGVLKKLYAGVKRQLSRKDKTLAEQSLALKATTKKLAEMESRLIGSSKKDAEGNLVKLRRAALEAQDFDKFEEYDSKLAEVRKVSTQVKEIPVPEFAADEDDDSQDAVREWQAKRPWANEGHELYEDVVGIGASVLNSKKFKDAPIEEQLAEIDRRVALVNGKATHAEATVLSGAGGPSGKAKGGPKLSDEQKKLAHRWFSDKEPKEAEELWASAVSKSKAKKNQYFGASGNA